MSAARVRIRHYGRTRTSFVSDHVSYPADFSNTILQNQPGPRGSAVGIVTMLRAERYGVFQIPHRLDPALWSHAHSCSVYRRSFQSVKRPGPEVNHSSSNDELKNEWTCTSTSPVYLHGVNKGCPF